MQLKSRWNNIPFNPRKVPFFYGWVILFASTVGILVSAPGQTMGVSTFTDHLLINIGISRNQLSLAYMIGTIGSSLILTYAGTLYDKYGARWVGIIVSLMLAIVLVFLSQSDRIIRFFVPYSSSALYVTVAMGILVLLIFMLRFSGQGVLTMISRNMLMKWFDAHRGLANGISSVFIALGFSVAPLTFDMLIQSSSWRNAWLIMAVSIGLVFTVFVFVFFRDNPQELKMQPDGDKTAEKQKNKKPKKIKEFSLKEARGTFTFWLFALPLALFALYITGFTFHLISIFEAADMDRDKALAVFIPISVISVTISLVGGWISDRIKLKYLLYLILTGQAIALFSLGKLNGGIYYYGFIAGNAIVNGLFNVLMAVTWPRFYGYKHLGKITGFVMSLTVFASALGPVLYSFSFTKLGSYSYGFFFLAGIAAILLALSFKADNPQDKLEILPEIN